jgi:hypothetical protein
MGERLTVDAQLTRAAASPRRRTVPVSQSAAEAAPRPENPQGPVVVPDDFKDDPY